MNEIRPPEYFLRFFKRFCDPDLHPFIEGDLHELYRERVAELGKKKADRRFALDVLLLFRPGVIRSVRLPFIDNLINRLDMLKSYFKIGFRNLKKHRFFSLINLSGMTIGMCCFILIALYIHYETSYDRQHEKTDRIYRVSQWQEGNDLMNGDRFAGSSLPIPPTLLEEFPEIEAAVSLTVYDARFLKGEDFFHEQVLYAGKQLFDIFTYPVVEGVGAAALKDPNAIILTESMAKKYFGGESPIGKTMLFNQDRPLTVRGVVEDVPANQHFSFDCITTVRNYRNYRYDIDCWNCNNYHTYIVLPEGYDHKELDNRLAQMDHYFEAAYAHWSFQPTLFLQALADIHLHSHINGEIEVNGDIRYIYFSASIGLIILLLAAVNYMNLATARAHQRAKEVGVRKVLGAEKGQLVSQLMTESLLITFSSLLLGTTLASLLLPAFNQLLGQQVSFSLVDNATIMAGMLLLALVLGSLAGLYPAVLFAAVNPVKAFKGSFFKRRKDGIFLRNALVVGQFTAAIVLAVGSVVVYRQLRFIQNKKLGYSKDQIVYVPYKDARVFDKTALVRAELLKHPHIRQVSFADGMPVNLPHNNLVTEWEGNLDKQELDVYYNYVDYEFLDLFEIELVEGRNFSPDFPADSTNRYLLNETAVKILGWESAVGKSFKQGKVIGVVKDFHFHTLDRIIQPLFLTFFNRNYTSWGNIAMKIDPEDMGQTIAYVQQTLKETLPDLIFEHHFVDESYMQLYEAEKRFGRVFNIFTLLALFIACMGLLGLVTHQVLQRTKEIGIRKILGATVAGIVHLISRDFLKLVLISALIATPIAWWSMNNWLQDFAYRIDLNWRVFAIIGILAIGLAFLTVSAQAVRAASANPVDSLKIE